MPFPFPFDSDAYQYSNNAALLDPPCCFEITENYLAEMVCKRQLLAQYPERTFQSLPHTLDAQWEILGVVMRQLAAFYPTDFEVTVSGHDWTFVNHRLGETHRFRFGDTASLPVEPLNFIGRHVQEDLILMMERDGELYLDAGQLVFPGNWSIAFDLGMPFLRIHEPVPVLIDSGLGQRVRKFLLGITPDRPWRRLNWTLNAGSRLDTSPETFTQWGRLRYQVTTDNAGELVHLRVENQTLLRMTGNPGILFTIHTHLISLQDLVAIPGWGERLYRVLTTLSDPLTEYKGLRPYRKAVLEYLTHTLGLSAAETEVHR